MSTPKGHVVLSVKTDDWAIATTTMATTTSTDDSFQSNKNNNPGSLQEAKEEKESLFFPFFLSFVFGLLGMAFCFIKLKEKAIRINRVSVMLV